jgi:uncharacterized protein (DUF2267 family)
VTQTIDVFERTTHVTNRWLVELGEELGEPDRQSAYRQMRAVLHAVRDRLTVEESAQLADQLPVLVRGVFYEGWRPSRTPESYHDADELLRRVAMEAHLAGETEASYAVAAVWRVLCRHVSEGELTDVRGVLPEPVRRLLSDDDQSED